MGRFQVKPISLKEANAFIIEYHRHHYKIQGHKFSIACYKEDKLRGVAICGRPVARHLDNGMTMEITRLCTDGARNACSFLYGACARISKELGYEKIITYILQSEDGASLKASNFQLDKERCGGKYWKRSDGIRTKVVTTLFGEVKKYPQELKKRYVKCL